jgi:uncharacterized membrane protein YkvA (DUF1232 family)
MSKFTSARSVQSARHGWHLFRNRKVMWQMMREALNGRYRMSLFTTLVFLFTIAYVIFPFDLIPDYIPVIGWIDDGFVVFLLIKQLNKETQRYNRFKASARRSS